MIYPQKINAKKSNFIIKILAIVSILIAIVLIIINKLLNEQVPWAALCNAGIIYIWITVIYSINRNTNIAAHVLIQSIAISFLTLYIDYRLGFERWSINIAIPIIIIVANVTMFILTIVSYKKYIKYAIYQLIIVVFSMIPIFLMFEHVISVKLLGIIAGSVSVFNFLVTLFLCTRDLKEVIKRKFHM